MDRKKDHIELAKKAQTNINRLDDRFYYEPLFSSLSENNIPETNFAGKTLKYPVWISSITGGTALAKTINSNLAKLAGKYKLGMALGSCRCLLDSDNCLDDLNVRKYIGNQALYANLGIAQIEQLIENGQINKVNLMLQKINADGLFIHINPLQEIFQPEGDRYKKPAIETLKIFLDKIDFPVFVKEVGQGFGPKSLKALAKLNIQGIELASYGGTNFAKLELQRTGNNSPMAYVGNSLDEMIEILNNLDEKLPEIIVSGGIRNSLDGYYYIKKLKTKAVYGQAFAFLEKATGSFETLEKYFLEQMQTLNCAYSFLELKK